MRKNTKSAFPMRRFPLIKDFPYILAKRSKDPTLCKELTPCSKDWEMLLTHIRASLFLQSDKLACKKTQARQDHTLIPERLSSKRTHKVKSSLPRQRYSLVG
jgi:hypothetical protein